MFRQKLVIFLALFSLYVCGFFYSYYGFFIFLLRKRNLIQDTGNKRKKVGVEVRNGQDNQQKSSGKVFKSIAVLHVYLDLDDLEYITNNYTPNLITDKEKRKKQVNPYER